MAESAIFALHGHGFASFAYGHDITAYIMRVIFMCQPRIPIFRIFGLKYLSALIR